MYLFIFFSACIQQHQIVLRGREKHYPYHVTCNTADTSLLINLLIKRHTERHAKHIKEYFYIFVRHCIWKFQTANYCCFSKCAFYVARADTRHALFAWSLCPSARIRPHTAPSTRCEMLIHPYVVPNWIICALARVSGNAARTCCVTARAFINSCVGHLIHKEPEGYSAVFPLTTVRSKPPTIQVACNTNVCIVAYAVPNFAWTVTCTLE